MAKSEKGIEVVFKKLDRVVCIKGSKRGMGGEVQGELHFKELGIIRVVVHSDNNQEITSARDRWRPETPEDLVPAPDLPQLEGTTRAIASASRIREIVLAELVPSALEERPTDAPRCVRPDVMVVLRHLNAASLWLDYGVKGATFLVNEMLAGRTC